MSFDEVLFPQDISAGSSFGPEFSTTVSETGAKTERRNQNWSYARYRGDLVYGMKTDTQLLALLNFFLLRRGRARGFRYRDPQDNSMTDEVMQRITETSGEHDYQIVKRYTDPAGNEYVRKITKPVGINFPYGQASATDVIKIDGGAPLTRDVDYTIDYATGIVTISAGDDTESAVVTCTCTFDVPTRFDTDFLPQNLETYQASKTAVPIIEYEEAA
jgi:uncharacterized protein (TIGR02217 family)